MAIALAVLGSACFSAGGDEDAPNIFAYNVLINSSWAIIACQLDTADVSSTYAPYRFNFYDTGALDAEITIGSPEATGTWAIISGEAIRPDKMALNFLSTDSLSLLNGLWTINNITSTRVNCERDQGEVLILQAL